MDILRETALVGTEKKPLDTSVLPDAVKHILVAGEPEAEFLQAVTLLYFYERAGSFPPAYKGTVDETVIDEEKPIAPPELLELYGRFGMIDYHLRDAILRLWLDVLIDKAVIVDPLILVNLIRDGQNAPTATKAKILRVIGNKGVWILRNDPSLSYPVQTSGNNKWEEGTTQERKDIFSSVHAQNPAAAIQLLQSTWPTESVVTKKAFLDLLKGNFITSDVPFAEACYNGEFKYQPKEKKTERECRKVLASLLLSLSGTALHETVTERLDAYHVRTRKGIMGFVTGKEPVSFQLPETGDGFWNGRYMEETFGLETSSFDIALFSSPQLYWLSCLLQWIPMSYWTNHFDRDVERTVDYWLTNKEYQSIINGEVVPVFRQALMNNALMHRDDALAWTLVNRINSTDILSLLAIITPANFESFIRRNRYFNDIEFLSNGPFDLRHSWSLPFSDYVIEQAYDEAMRNTSSASVGKIIAQYAHTESIGTLYRFNEKARESASYNVWNTGIFQVASAAMEIRYKINGIKK